MLRDSQRSKVYKAESLVPGYWTRNFDSNFMVRKYLDLVIKTLWVKGLYREELDGGVKLYPLSSNARRSWAHSGGMAISVYGRTKFIILHELAHVLTLRKYGARFIAGHGWQFCQTHLELIKLFIGKDAYLAMKKSYDDLGVRYKAPRKRQPLTEEQREVLRERLADARRIKQLKKKEAA